MSERPLLLFPQPEVASRSNLGGGGGRVHIPSSNRQGARLTPIFNQLQSAFNDRRVEIQQTTAGADPEQVLVMETIGGIENFANAVKRIDGFEWMGELEVDEIAPDADFFNEAKPEKELSGRLYLVMTNQRALEEMLSLWQRYKTDLTVKFNTGLNKFKDVFKSLKNVRRWGVEDRILETGVLEEWKEALQHDGGRVIRFEVELWFRNTPAKRQSSQAQVASLITELGGQILGQCVLSEITYHAFLAELPANAIQNIISDQNTALVQSDNIMFFRPSGQVSAGDKPTEGDLEQAGDQVGTVPSGDPVIAVLDGMPLANHQLLSNRIIVDDPDSWDSSYLVADRSHGTAMASLVVHGDLNSGMVDPLKTPIYMRPIMKPNPTDWRPRRQESIPEDVLVVDLIHRSVKRIFEGENGQPPVAPTVRIINLSIGDPCRQFSQTMSPIAKLIDWLSVKYGVLFVISAGNHAKTIALEITRANFNQSQQADIESATVKALYQNARNLRLLSPAESINGVTVGSAHLDYATGVEMGDRMDPYDSIVLPSPISAFGSGHRRSVKPDIVYSGGKQLYRPQVSGDPVTIEPVILRSSPGNKVACPSSLPGDTTSASHCCGTSNAAALITRAGGVCHNLLMQIFSEQAVGIEYAPYVAPLLKAMLVHGSEWGNSSERILQILRTPDNARQLKSWIARWIGYGLPQIERVLECTEQRVTLLGFGGLKDSEAHVFKLPLPPSLGSRTDWRKLTVTLAWISPVSTSTQRYRTASLWFETNNSVASNRSNVDGKAVRRGTLQHEIFEGQEAIPFADGEVIEIKVNCRNDAGKITMPVSYGIAATLEVGEGVNIAIYDEIRTRILASVRIQSGDRR
jgi:hypothetical protein